MILVRKFVIKDNHNLPDELAPLVPKPELLVALVMVLFEIGPKPGIEPTQCDFKLSFKNEKWLE